MRTLGFPAGWGLLLGILALAASADDVAKYGSGSWDSESGVGQHRVVLRVDTSDGTNAVRARIPWRRRDVEPEKKGLVLVDAATGRRVTNLSTLSVTRESGDIIFEPATAPGDYYLYYLPYASEGRKNYPNVKYTPAVATADPAWLSGIRPDGLPGARVVEIQSADAFGSFFPMEVIATAAETRDLLARHAEAPYLVFPEERRYSIRMTDDLPFRWIEAGPRSVFRAAADRGEYFTWQIAVWAARSALENLEVRFSAFARTGPSSGPAKASGPDSIPAAAATCFNTGGVDWDGRAFRKAVDVPLGKIQALWCGLDIPRGIAPGTYAGTVTVAPRGALETSVRLEFDIGDRVIDNRGDDDPYRMSRLRWLDSTIASDDEVVPPFPPLIVEGREVACLGRALEIGPTGLPSRLRSFFTPEMTRVDTRQAVELLARPMTLEIDDAAGRRIAWTPAANGPAFIMRAAGAVVWRAENTADGLEMTVEARMEFDGFVEFKVAITSAAEREVGDVALEIPLRPEAATHMMGLGFKGGRRPASFDWTWDRTKNQDALWIGAVNAGLQVALRAENYIRPLNTNFYLSQPLNLPPSWGNEGRGAVAVKPEPGAVLVRASSGPRTIPAGQTLHFDFNLLLTPFKPLATRDHFSRRFFHAFKPLDEIAATGANVVNVHHATDINPWINYPFLRPAEMKAYVDDAHHRGFKVKIYDTIRELSNRAPEFFALRSLGGEIFSRGPGGGYAWLQEHVGGDYIPAWFVPELKDAALVNSGMSRWHNYYLEGLDWLARNVGIDGLYLDDVAFDRTTMKRLRRILARRWPEPQIDLHSANQYNPRDGFASSANLYLEHFPFLDRLWFGEYFDYNGSGPDYWLVEVSGIPFGLMGEMLQDGGNPWRGAVFGMTSRLPWAGDPRPVWKAWDDFGIREAEMLGWWTESNPVRTGHPQVLATSFVKNGPAPRSASRNGGRSVLIALASWAEGSVEVTLSIDWRKLGLDPKRVTLRAPAIESFQPAAEFRPGGPIRVEPGKGWLLVLE